MREINNEIIEIGNRIYKKRIELNMTQEQLSNSCGISIPYISRVEKGRVNITERTLIAISKAFNCDIEYLRTGIEKKDSSSIEKPLMRKKLNDSPLERLVFDILKICDNNKEELECFEKVLLEYKNFETTFHILDHLSPSDANNFYNNCLDNIENINNIMEESISRFSEDFNED